MSAELVLESWITSLQSLGDGSFGCEAEHDFKSLQIEQLDAKGVQKLRTLAQAITEHIPEELSIHLLYTLIERYPKNSLTPIHAILVRQCCKIRRYELAIPLLQRPLEVISDSHRLVYQDHLLYHFYGSLCHAARRDWIGAHRFLSLALSTGGQYTSLIQLEAYRKFILISLIQHGKLLPLPTTLHSNTRRSLDVLAAEYLEFAELYASSTEKFLSAAETKGTEIAQHGNAGLLKSAIASIPGHKILHLQGIYKSISLSALGSKIGLSESDTSQLLAEMTEQGRLSAHVDDAGDVQFTKKTTTSVQQLQALERDLKTINSLRDRMTLLQKMLELDPDYLSKTAKDNLSEGTMPRHNLMETMHADDSEDNL